MDHLEAEKVATIIEAYSSSQPQLIAQALRTFWLEFEPNQGIQLIKVEQRQKSEAAGIPIPVLKAIGNEIARAARKDVDGFLPLAQMLWDEYGREGRVVALIVFGTMELVDPDRLVPLMKTLCKQCFSWEDADRLAMDAVEPVVRKHPDRWLQEMVLWLEDENKWVRRAAVTIIGRLPMKHPARTAQCLEYAGHLLPDTELDVKRAVSFAIRVCARIDPGLTIAFLKKHIPPANMLSTWVLCDVIKSLDRRLVTKFSVLLPVFQEWSRAPQVSAKEQRSIESALKVLQG